MHVIIVKVHIRIVVRRVWLVRAYTFPVVRICRAVVAQQQSRNCTNGFVRPYAT